MENKNVRLPTKDELQDLKNYFMFVLGQDEVTAQETVDTYWYAVFEKYISDSPAYVGKLMVAVYGMPDFYEVFVWNREGLVEKVDLDSGFYPPSVKGDSTRRVSTPPMP